ncbi:MAG: DUF58 domain-containing protein [Saprospiraceae bacterium]|nr:DUF58 domain-containing protein [Bacteroidia bacterium]NNE14638.1 DUF58 domain-containing protein [Saprospiraceae bacterium]NNL91858.1 DUF58 domain-containing protein [Saprospiraceae bacterium]
MDASEILKKIRKIEIKTKGLSKHIFSGEYHSAFKGRGMSFSEVRDYQYGDDVRNIDWNVTARTGDPHIKVFEEDRELTVMLLVDISKSSYFGTVNQFKSELTAEISAVIAFSAITNNDKVGAILYTDKVEKYIPPKKGKSHILRIIREIIYLEPESNGTNIDEALIYLNNIQKKRAIVFVLSDFMCQGYESALSIASKRHDIIGLHIFDKIEKHLPNIGIINTIDSESGQAVILDTSSKKVREKYNNWFENNYEYFKSVFNRYRSDNISISTESDYVKLLLQFFKRRSS